MLQIYKCDENGKKWPDVKKKKKEGVGSAFVCFVLRRIKIIIGQKDKRCPSN